MEMKEKMTLMSAPNCTRLEEDKEGQDQRLSARLAMTEILAFRGMGSGVQGIVPKARGSKKAGLGANIPIQASWPGL